MSLRCHLFGCRADLQEVSRQGRHSLSWVQSELNQAELLQLCLHTATIELLPHEVSEVSMIIIMQGTGRNKKNGNMFERWK